MSNVKILPKPKVKIPLKIIQDDQRLTINLINDNKIDEDDENEAKDFEDPLIKPKKDQNFMGLIKNRNEKLSNIVLLNRINKASNKPNGNIINIVKDNIKEQNVQPLDNFIFPILRLSDPKNQKERPDIEISTTTKIKNTIRKNFKFITKSGDDSKTNNLREIISEAGDSWTHLFMPLIIFGNLDVGNKSKDLIKNFENIRSKYSKNKENNDKPDLSYKVIYGENSLGSSKVFNELDSEEMATPKPKPPIRLDSIYKADDSSKNRPLTISTISLSNSTEYLSKTITTKSNKNDSSESKTNEIVEIYASTTSKNKKQKAHIKTFKSSSSYGSSSDQSNCRLNALRNEIDKTMNEICTFKNEVNSRLQNRFDTLQRKANILLTDTAINTDISMSNAIFKIKYDDVTDDDENEDLINTTATSKSIQNAQNTKKINKSLSNQDILINRFLSSKKNQSYTPLNVPVVESPSSTASHYTSNCSSSANQIPALTLLRDRLDRTLNSSNISLTTTDSVNKYSLSKSKYKRFNYQRLNETPEELNEYENENVFKRIFARNDFNQKEEFILPELNITSSSFDASTGSSKISVGEGNSASESISNKNFIRKNPYKYENYFEPIQKEFRTTPIPKDKYLIMSSIKSSKKQPIKKQPVYDFGLHHQYSMNKYNYAETSDSPAMQEEKIYKKLHKEPSSSKSKPKYDNLKLKVMPLKRNASEISTCQSYHHETPQLNNHFYAHINSSNQFSSRQTPYYQTTTTTTYNCPCCTRLNSLNVYERNSLIRNNSFTSSDSDKINLVMNIKDKRYRSASKNAGSRLADDQCRCHSTQRYTTSKKIYRNEHGFAASEKKSDQDEEFKLDSINFRNIFKKYNDELIPELGRESNVGKSDDKNILNSYYDLNDDQDSEIDQEMVSKEIEITLNSLHRPHSAVFNDYKENELNDSITSSSNYLNTNVYNSYILNESRLAKDISIPKKLTEEVEEPSVYSKHQFYSEYPKSNHKMKNFLSNRKLNVEVNKHVDNDLNVSDVFSDKSLTDFQKAPNPSEKPKKENSSKAHKIKEPPVKYFINYPILSDSGLNNNLDNSVSYVSGMNNDNSSSTKSISKSNSNLMDSESSTVILNSFKLF